MGKKMVPMYARELKKSTWSQMSWIHLPGCSGENNREHIFRINGMNSNINAMDYLLAVALELTFPNVTLANTEAPVEFSTTDTAGNTVPLFYYLSDGSVGIPAGQLLVGSEDALQALILSNVAAANAGATANQINAIANMAIQSIQPFVSYAPRHRVGWGQNAVLAAIDDVSWNIDGVEYEEKRREAIYADLQTRLREDVFPVAGYEATSLDAVLVPATVGDGENAVLGCTCGDDERYRAFTVPFSFTTSALADRGQDGKHKSAFPVLMACKNILEIRVRLIEDLRKILVLEEEVLTDFSQNRIVFVSLGTELGLTAAPVPGIPPPLAGAINLTDNINNFTTNATNFSIVPGTETFTFGGAPGNTFGVFTTVNAAANGTLTVTTNGTTATFGPTNPFTLANLGVLFLEQSNQYLPITRPTEYSFNNPFSREFSYNDFILENKLEVTVRSQANTAIVTDLERGMMKADCRNKKWMYERYSYYGEYAVAPGDPVKMQLCSVPGALKYFYVFGQNELSRLQGQFFNYTNDTDFEIVLDTDLVVPKYFFQGKDSIERIATKIQGFRDEDHPTAFLRHVDNALFTQRAPRVRGIHVIRYGNWQNSIYPDGSINAQAIGDIELGVKTARSGLLSLTSSPYFNTCNSFAYNVNIIAVSACLVVFGLSKCK